MQLTGYGLKPSELGFDVPGDEFRPNQLELAERIVNSDKRVILLIAPTGLGKSLINQIPGRVQDKRTLILTSTIQLQDQYGEQQGLPVLMGRGRYICNRWETVTAAEAVCRIGIKCGLMFSGECDYYHQKFIAANSETAVLNYAVFFRLTASADNFSGWDWLVLDEAHGVPAELTAAFTVSIQIKSLLRAKIPPPLINDVANWRLWALNNEGKIRKLISNREKKVTADQIEPYYQIVSAMEILKTIHDTSEWAIYTDGKVVTILPVWPNSLASKAIWSQADKFILSSATLEPYTISAMLGIPLSDMEILSVGSYFPVENRPINIMGHHRVSHASTDEDLEGLIFDIDRVIDKYAGQRGLVHTSNYALSLTIAERSRNQDRLLYHDSLNRLDMFDLFLSEEGEGKVLLSPAMVEGIDLPYDACRFQIIAKVPYENITSDLWRARFQSDIIRARLAYTGNAISAIVQASGRGMRAADDYCDTWILDRAFNRIRAESNYRLPDSFVEAVRYITEI